MKAYHVQGPGGQNEPRSEDDGGEVDDGRPGWPEMRCCTQDDDRGQVEVMEVMMMKSMVTDMQEMDPLPHKTKQQKEKKPRSKAEPGNPSLKVSVGQLPRSIPHSGHSKWQIINPA